MAIGIRVGNRYWEIGSSDFLHGFFSTVSYHLEPQGWGSRFGALMNDLYTAGTLRGERAAQARQELAQVKAELAQFNPSQVVWDIEKLDARPPWGDNISPEIRDLSNYFWTSDGRDLFEVIDESIAYLERSGQESLQIR